MTADLLENLIRAQVAASLMTLLVLAVRRPARRLVGARTAYGLWLLPLIAAGAALIPAQVRYAALPVATGTTPSITAAQTAPFAPAVESAAALPVIDLAQAALWLWALGAALSFAWLAIQQVRYFSLVREGSAGPAVVGVLRPRMILPADFEARYSEQERALILEHEVTHLRRQDPRVIALALALRCLAWFNPLAYVAVKKLRIDQELACDETVVSRFPKERRAYAGALAKSQLAIRPLPLGCYWPSGTEHPLLERLNMLTIKTSPKSRLVGASALGVLAAAAGFATWAAIPAEVRYLPSAPAEAVATLAAEPAAEAPEATAAEEAPAADEAAAAEAVVVAVAEPEPQAPARPAPPLPDVYNGFADTNLAAPVTVNGVIDHVEWLNPRTYVHVRDTATGDVRPVALGTPNSLLRLGGSRQILAVGTPISVDGYASTSGKYVSANPAGMSSNGAPLIPAAADHYAQRLPALQRLRFCGVGPIQGPPNLAPTPEAQAAQEIWNRDCDAKMRAAGAPGAIVEQSAFTNSVVREGAPRP